jgi:hypothetical protein
LANLRTLAEYIAKVLCAGSTQRTRKCIAVKNVILKVAC